MYCQVDSVESNLSASANLDTLTQLRHKDGNYLAVHNSEKVSVLSIGASGGSSGIEISSVKEFTFDSVDEDNRKFIQRIKLVSLQDKVFLVVVSSKIITVFSIDANLIPIFSHTFNTDQNVMKSVYSVATLSKSILAVALQSKVYFFTTNRSGSAWKVKDVEQELRFNSRSVICNFTADGRSHCALVESNGTITVWKLEDSSKMIFSKIILIELHTNTKCTGLHLLENLLILSTVSGQIQLFNLTTGLMLCEIQAHVKCITAFDVVESGHMVTASEDSHIRVFRLHRTSEDDLANVEFLDQSTLANEMICGVKFLDSEGKQFATSSYESSFIKIFRITQ